MAQVKTETTVDDLLAIVGLLSFGQDPTQLLTPEQVADYTLLGRQMVEAVMVRRKNDELTAALTLTQARMSSMLQVAPAEEPDTPDAGG